MTIKICVSILPKTIDETLNLIEKAENYNADFIEVRLDCLKKWSKIADIANHGRVPIIATNRSQSCHGKFAGSETERLQILLKAARGGFRYVDIELSTPKLKDFVKDLIQLDVKPIISFHDFSRSLSLKEMYDILLSEIENNADICKIVTTANNIEDNLSVLNFISKACRKSKIVCFSMGELGKPSRLLSPLFGGFFTFAALEKTLKTGPGQMSIQEMKAAYQAIGVA